MTETPDAASSGGSEDMELGWSVLLDLLNASATRTVYYQVAEMLDGIELTDDEIEAMRKMPRRYLQTATASFLDYAEALREGSRSLDTQLMKLTGELV